MVESQSSTKPFFYRKRFWLVFIYVAVLIWSGIYRYNNPASSVADDKSIVRINAFDGNRKLNSKIRFAYKEYSSEQENDKLPVILIHGSPGSSRVFDGLAKLINNRRLISVDLPGFGDSEQNIPDYSIYAHAKYLRKFLKEQNIRKAHFVGFSLGGGVILHLTEFSPESVASVSFISSIGVQEYELLGNYHANRIVHGLQLAACWIAQELVPHFGSFDGMPMSYSRNFFDTDQRPLRGILKKIDQPFQIVHGKNDPLVPVEAAREHARIVPQSEFHELDEDHFFIFLRPEKVSDLLKTFWERVETEEEMTRANADPKRISEAKKPFEFQILVAKGATVFVLFLMLVVIVFFNEDLAFILSGVFIAQGRFGFAFGIITCLIGMTLSIVIWLLLARFLGSRFRIFDRLKSESAFLSRNFGFRFPVYFAAGKSDSGFWSYPVKFILTSSFWTMLIIFASYLLASFLDSLSVLRLQNTLGIILVAVFTYVLIAFTFKRIAR